MYKTLRYFMDLPAKSTLLDHFSEIIAQEKDNITNIENTPEVIYNYRKSNNIDESFDIVLGIDACSFDRTSIDGKKYSFCFYGQPINPKFPCFPIFIIPTPNGKACESILNITYDLISILSDCNINVLYVSTDGDSEYNQPNEDTFDIYI